jgi:hypothetical protein
LGIVFVVDKRWKKGKTRRKAPVATGKGRGRRDLVIRFIICKGADPYELGRGSYLPNAQTAWKTPTLANIPKNVGLTLTRIIIREGVRASVAGGFFYRSVTSYQSHGLADFPS